MTSPLWNIDLSPDCKLLPRPFRVDGEAGIGSRFSYRQGVFIRPLFIYFAVRCRLFVQPFFKPEVCIV